MIESGATATYQRPPFIYGEILSRSMCEADRPELPGIGRFLSQGAAIGAFISFLFPLYGIVSTRGYTFLLIGALPFFLAGGIAFGLLQGFGMWGCTRLAGHRITAAARAIIGSLIFAILLVVYDLVFPPSPYASTPTLEDYLWAIPKNLPIGVTFGLVIGSRLQPWRELVRGAKSLPAQSRLLTGITGLVLRVIIIFFLMDSVLMFVWMLKFTFQQPESVFVLIALCHFAAALVIVFARLKFWLMLPLALIVNLPILAFITEVLKEEHVFMWYVSVGYLAVWAAFLLTRWDLTYSALAFVKEEIRYYLID